MSRRIRVVVGKIGLDGHNRGAKIIAAGLRDAGYEVIYTGIRQTPQKVVSIALQEDADVLAISILSGAHNKLCKKTIDLLRENGEDDIVCIVGGIIPDGDVEYLKSIGFSNIFTPGTKISDIVQCIEEELDKIDKNYVL